MKRRILSLLLVLCMLLSTAVLFASCGKKTVSLAGYSVVYGKDASSTMTNEITDFADSIEAKTGEKVSLQKVNAGDALDNEADLEILIGNTNRPETAKALKKVKGHGYTVAVVGKKLVIAGTTNLLTLLALDHFKATCLSGDVTAITVEKTVVSDLPMTEITSSTAFIHTANLQGLRENFQLEFLVEQINELKNALPKFSAIKGSSMPTKTDAESAASEILVGMVDREECRTFTSGMNAYNYGVGASNGKLIIAGYNDAMAGKAMELAKHMLEDSVCEIEEKKRIFIPSDFSRIFTDTESAFFDDFPKPELPITGTMDVGDNSLEYCYQGEGVNADAYYAYCEVLEAAGYTVHGNSATIENSIFRTYVNTEKNATLYVCYSAFKHATAQKVTLFKPAIRVISAPLDAVNLLADDMLTQDLSYTKLTYSSITGVRMDSDQSTDDSIVHGNNYIITLEDGSFIVYDGGQSQLTNQKRLYEVLLALYKKTHNNEAPTTDNPLRISAWILSHGHSDHFNTMVNFVKTYCANYQTYKITLDRLITNFSSNEELYVTGNGNKTVMDLYATMSSKIKDAPGEEQGFKYYKVHTGQKFYLANLEFEVIHTHEDLYPMRIYRLNESTTVFRMTMHNTTNHVIDQASSTSMMWLGDAEDPPSACMRATYGAYLDSDMVQVAHHDYQGSEYELYELISPECVWWPVIRKRYNKTCHTKESNHYYRVVNYKINYELASVKHIFLLDQYNYTLSITEGGPDYSIYGQSSSGICHIGEDGNITAVPIEFVVSNNVSTSYIRK